MKVTVAVIGVVCVGMVFVVENMGTLVQVKCWLYVWDYLGMYLNCYYHRCIPCSSTCKVR
jgi:hypothetical protein